MTLGGTPTWVPSAGPTKPPTPLVSAAPRISGDRFWPRSSHIVDVGDKVKVTVFGESELSGTFEVNGGGQLPVPLIGELPARDRTVTELREAIAQRLAKGYLKNPKVSIEIVSFRPIYVHGEVRSGGEFAFKNGLRIRDAVAMAGGYSYRADQSFILITRNGSAEEFRVDLPSELAVMPGDNIRVPERFF